MSKTFRHLLLAALLPSAQALQASTTLPVQGVLAHAGDKNISYMGRVSLRGDSVAAFNFPGTTISARFTGTSLKMKCRPETGYFMVSVDGHEPFKVGFNSKRDSVVTLATALPQGEHVVRAMYVIEGLFRHPEFHGFVLDKGARTLPYTESRKLKIEFIGNSITCGYGVESIEMTDPFEDETENHALTYANLVSDSLNALHTSISRSGIGVYRNYDGPREGSPEDMPWQYDYTLFGDHSEPWDFSRYQPDVVFINLGTNDLSTNNYDIHRYDEAYREFLTHVREVYPSARIIIATGPMLGDKESSEQRAVLDRICRDFTKKGDKRLYRFDFSFQTGDLGYGASWHPSKLQHEKMAGELMQFIREKGIVAE